MKVMIGKLTILVESKEDFDQLREWCGQEMINNPAPEKNRNGNGSTLSEAGGTPARDRLILEKLVESGDTGILTTVLGDWLGRKGKAVGPGLLQWAIRVGLVTDDTNNPVEKARPEGARGWKLKSSFIPYGKKLLEDKK